MSETQVYGTVRQPAEKMQDWCQRMIRSRGEVESLRTLERETRDVDTLRFESRTEAKGRDAHGDVVEHCKVEV